MKILCIGEALIDMICTDKGSTLSEGKNFLKKAGGAPANVAAIISALGGEVELAVKVGVDPFGTHLVDELTQFGVSPTWMLRDPDHFTTFAFVSLMENGERDFYFNRGADGQLSVDDMSGIEMDEFSIIHFGSATAFLPGPLQATYLAMLQKATEKNTFISFDPNYRHLLFGENKTSFTEQSWNFLKACNFFKMSDEEALLITGAATLNEAVMVLQQQTTAVFTITLGKEGTLLCMDKKQIIIPSISINAVDTTGAGDAFTGAVLYQLNRCFEEKKDSLSQHQWEEIVANANRAGARTCEYMGGMEAFRHLDKSIF